MSAITLTPVRRRILLAVRDEIGRFYLEAGQVYDGKTGRKHTAEFRKLLAAGWVRVARADERRPEELKFRTYYRVDDAGERRLAAVQKGQNNNG
jgi:hypothetical protein